MTDSLQAAQQEIGMTTSRIEALTDGVFAIAMTLLAFNLNFPDTINSVPLHELLFEQSHGFYNYVLSFMLLAVFWIIHHQQFYFIKRPDRRLLWMNIVILMFVALIPFTTSVVGDYPDDLAAKLIFGSNLFVLGWLFFLNWVYATHGYRLIDRRLDPERIKVSTRRTLVIVVVAPLAMLLAFINPAMSSYVYLLIPFVLMFPKFRYNKKA